MTVVNEPNKVVAITDSEPINEPDRIKLSKKQLEEELVSLDKDEFEFKREELKTKYGVRIKYIESEYKRLKTEDQQDSSDVYSIFPTVTPWDSPVNGAELIKGLDTLITRFVICDTTTRTAVALWVIMTYLPDVVDCLPIANITAPEKGCGKTTMLELIGKLSNKSLTTGNITGSALFRVIEKYSPTLLIDEADSFADDNEAIRGILNAGHTRSSSMVIRCVGDDHEPTPFHVFCPKALSGIGSRQGTVTSRSINIKLRRKLANEKIERLKKGENDFAVICRKLLRWADDNRASIKDYEPIIPKQLINRDADNWEPLLAIAEHLGREAVDKANKAAIELTKSDDDNSVAQELLQNIQDVFSKLKVKRIFTTDLVIELINLDESMWLTYNRGKPISPKQIANKLGQFGIKSKTMRIGCGNKKGYEIDDFNDSFKRYIT